MIYHGVSGVVVDSDGYGCGQRYGDVQQGNLLPSADSLHLRHLPISDIGYWASLKENEDLKNTFTLATPQQITSFEPLTKVMVS